MEIFALFVVVLGAVIALYLQQQMTMLQYTASPAADLSILFSRQVVTPHGVLSAAVHVAGGRIQAVVPCDKPPRNTKVREAPAPPRRRKLVFVASPLLPTH